jgi:hypothetical protein
MEDLQKQIQEDILKLKAIGESDQWKDLCAKKNVEIEAIKEMLDQEVAAGEVRISPNTVCRRTSLFFQEFEKEVETALEGLAGVDLLIKPISNATRAWTAENYRLDGQEFEDKNCQNDVERKKLSAFCNLTGDTSLNTDQIPLTDHLIKGLEDAVKQANAQVEAEQVLEQNIETLAE